MHIKKPHGRHRGYRLFDQGTTIKDPELDAINADMLAGRLDPTRARQLVEALRAKLTKPTPVSWLPENMAIVEAWLAFRDEHGAPIRSPRAREDRVKWAVKLLGSTSLLTCTRGDLKRAISHLDANGQRRAISVFNALTRFKRLDKELQPPERLYRPPNYIVAADLDRLLIDIPRPEDKLWCQTAFATGARYGEVFDFTPFALREDGTHIQIDAQRFKDWRQGPTKNSRTGTAFILPAYRDAVAAWCHLDENVKRAMRAKAQPYDVFKRAAAHVLQRDLTLHELRHSYAKACCEMGADLMDLERWMRDLRTTIEQYYVNWVTTSEEMRSAVRRFG